MTNPALLVLVRLVVLSLLLGTTGVTRAQDVASDPNSANNPIEAEAVPLKERPLTEKATQGLRKKWVEHLKQRGKKPATVRAVPVPMPEAVEDERKFEETLPLPQRQSNARKSMAEYVEPEVLRSKNGVLRVNLVAGHAHNRIGNDPVYLRAFNGKLVGPTLRVHPGDKIHLTLKNTMPGERWLPHMMNTLNSFNTLNMHYHGLHVSPNGISDNVLIQVGPHETQEYVIDIPKDHTTGTYWYHPHRHGSTAGDVASGMSGALIIEANKDEPGLDNIPQIKAARDRVMVLNQIPYIYKNTLVDPNSTTEPPATVTFDLKEGLIEVQYASFIFGPGDWAKLGRYTTINGVQLPVIRMRPGQVERWRFVDSGQREMIMLKIVPNPAVKAPQPPINFQEIAVDGLALGKMVDTPTVELWPGYRSDVLVHAPEKPGEYLLIDDFTPASSTISGQDKPLNYVARIVIEGPPQPMQLPKSEDMTKLRLPSIADSEITGKQNASYGILLIGEGNDQKVVFTIDGKSFDMETARTLKLNDVDEWTIQSINDVGPVTHPFHIHVNPFEVTSIMAPDPADPMKLVELLKDGAVWRDTVKIPGNGTVKLRTRYTDFIGTFVQHCHILDHEDQGMMQLIDIVDPKANGNASVNPEVPNLVSTPPDVKLPDQQGKDYALANHDGRPQIVFFFKGHGCLHCVQQISAFTEHYEAFRQNGIQIIGVTSDSVETLKAALESRPCPFTLLADPKGFAFAKYGCVKVDGLQHGTFVIDAQRQVTWSTVGASPYLAVKDLLEKFKPNSSIGKTGNPLDLDRQNAIGATAR